MKKTVICATGDSLFVARFPAVYGPELERIRDAMAEADLRLTNLETNICPFGDYAGALSGGTWLNAEPEALDDLCRFGFDYYATGNNHCMDYSYHGLLSTLRELDKRGLAHSGTGRSLAEAGAPAILGGAERTAVICATASFHDHGKAGNPSLGYAARPGVNYVRHTETFGVSGEDLRTLREIADRCGVNDSEKLSVSDGFQTAAEESVFSFGGLRFTEGTERHSACHPKDLARIAASVRAARAENDRVIVMLHSHERKAPNYVEVPEFYEELAHACVDAGACAVIGNGSHQLRPVEIYRGVPVFYSLGDFIYQGMEVPFLPADFMEKYGVPDDSTAAAGLDARSKGGRIGLQTKRCNFLSALPLMEFTGSRCTSLSLLPLDLGFEKKSPMKGLPCFADEKTGREICGILNDVSASYGTRFTFADGKIVCAIPE